MVKHHHQSKSEQLDNKEHGAAAFHYDPYQASKLMESKDNQTRDDVEKNHIQHRAYQIYLEKGGSHLDNWLEAERTIRNIH